MNTGSNHRSSFRLRVVFAAMLTAAFYAGSRFAAAQVVPVPLCRHSGWRRSRMRRLHQHLCPRWPQIRSSWVTAARPTQSTFNTPVALGIDRFNNVAIADQTNDLVRIIYNGGSAMAAAIVAANAQTTNLVPQVGYIYTIVGGPQSTPSQTTFYCTETGSGLIGFDKQLERLPRRLRLRSAARVGLR